MSPAPEQVPSQGEVVISIHELLHRWTQIPDVEDAYIVGIWNEDEPEDAMDEYATHPFWPTPYLLKEFDAYTLARDVSEARSEEVKVSRRFAFQMQYPATELFRIGHNTPVVQAPVFLRIRWGRGHPTITNRDAVQVEMLPHQKRPGSGERCAHCQGEVYGVPFDCPTRRLNALAEAIQSRTTHAELPHLLAVTVWHTPKEEDIVPIAGYQVATKEPQPMSENESETPGETVIEATLTPSTSFCIDIHHGGAHAHFDDVGPGNIVRVGGATFRLGSKIELVSIKERWGTLVPNCTRLASLRGTTEFREFMGDIQCVLTETPEANERCRAFMDWSFELGRSKEFGDSTSAACQWKGTVADFEFTCSCGAELHLDHQEFAYNVACPMCTAIFVCVDVIGLEPVEPKEGEKVHYDETEFD